MVLRMPKDDIRLPLFPRSPSMEKVSFSSITSYWLRCLNLILPEIQEFNIHQNKKQTGQTGEGKKQGYSQICTLQKGAPEMNTHKKFYTAQYLYQCMY